VRQLSKREERRHDSLGSSAAMLEAELKAPNSHRLTSLSGASHGHHSSFDRMSHNLDGFSQGETTSVRSGNSPGPSTPGIGPHQFTLLPGGADGTMGHTRTNSGTLVPPAPYYRPPRQRRPTLETTNEYHGLEIQDGNPIRIDATLQDSPGAAQRHSLISSTGFRDESDNARRNQPEYYSSREADFLYGVQRGRALSGGAPTRRRVTGPADPMSPVSNATGWFKSILNRRKKDNSKGFEVVRSTPLHLLREQDENGGIGHSQTRYMDAPAATKAGAEQSDAEWEIFQARGASGGAVGTERGVSRMLSVQSHAPEISPISVGGSIHFPSHLENDMEADTSYQPPSMSQTRTRPEDREIQRTPYLSSEENTVQHNQDMRSNSMASSIYPASLSENPHFSQQLSRGQVQQHLVGEGLRTYTMQPVHHGSAAELVDSAPGTMDSTSPPAPSSPAAYHPGGNFL